MVAFFMVLLWAASFGDTFYFFEENNMIEEWLICIQIYVIVIVSMQFKKKVPVE